MKKSSIKQRKVFSDSVRRQTVKDIETGKYTVLEASRELDVSQASVYNWIYRYSRYLQKNKVLIVEDKSESTKSKDLEKRIKDLEAALGRKQMEVELLNKLIELASEEYKTDLKKNFSAPPSNGSEFIKE